MRLVRLAAVALAMLVCAWFVVGIRQAHDTTQAQAILSGSRSLDATQARQASSLLDSAAVLNPDEEVQVLRGRVALSRGDKARALPILLAVTRAEPRSREAWLWLAQAAIGQNPALFSRALKTVFAIDPPPSRNR
jgi:predicted Zn-dependent protease